MGRKIGEKCWIFEIFKREGKKVFANWNWFSTFDDFLYFEFGIGNAFVRIIRRINRCRLFIGRSKRNKTIMIRKWIRKPLDRWKKKNETAYIREIFSRGYEYPIYRFVFARVHREITTTYSFLSNLRAHFITNTGNCWVGIVYGRKAIINIGSLVCADTRWNTHRKRERERKGHRFSFPSVCNRPWCPFFEKANRIALYLLVYTRHFLHRKLFSI